MSRFLPPIVTNDSCRIDSHDLCLSIEPDGRKLYTYTVTWHDLQQIKQSDLVDDMRQPTASPQFSFMNVSSKQVLSAEDIQICKRVAPSNISRSRTRECYCDGPCGKIKPVSEMHIMGRCDHYICQDCFEKAPVVENVDGFGCPNVRCYQTDLAFLSKNSRRRRHKIRKISTMPLRRMASTVTTIDKDEKMPNMLENMPCLSLVDVCLTTFIPLRNSDKICRQQQVVEIYGDYTMLQTLNVLKEYERLSSLDIANRVYYCPKGPINERSSWKHIREEDLSLPITKFGRKDQRIDIIFDCTAS
ncbi:hypothetical protein X798_01659 [Onchocerca flexuosa]|uniref:RING-type domain-containing protein n=1 Tax=Onchocerca flexuosa TaxID=387005 RepID=A0A238C1C0_9BILA|nr:hypothetical protein X798_01659 [Onchocerca flexuosa]